MSSVVFRTPAFTWILFLLSVSLCFSQNSLSLAKSYEAQGQYKQASKIYRKLLKADFSKEAYNFYLQMLLRVGKNKEALDFIETRRKKERFEVFLHVDYIYVLTLEEKRRQAAQYVKETQDLLRSRPHLLQTFAHRLAQRQLYEEALSVYAYLRKIKNDPRFHSHVLAQWHMYLGDVESGLEEFLIYLQKASSSHQYVLSSLQREYNGMNMKEKLSRAWLSLRRKYPENKDVFLLSMGMSMYWGNFAEAFSQARLLHMRHPRVGLTALMDVAFRAYLAQAYTPSLEVYEYVLRHARNEGMVQDAQEKILDIRDILLREQQAPDSVLVAGLVASYLRYGETVEVLHARVGAIHRAALLNARYLHKTKEAVEMLEGLLLENIAKDLRDKVKLDLGNLYIIEGRPWEAILLYRQVEYSQEKGDLYEQAKFFIAQASFYQGAFSLARAQLKILIQATSQRVANDALYLMTLLNAYVGISEEVDTLSTPVLVKISKARLYTKVGRMGLAKSCYEEVISSYPEHKGHAYTRYFLAETLLALTSADSMAWALMDGLLAEEESVFLLKDRILWRKAQAMEKNPAYLVEARRLYRRLITRYPDSIYVLRARARLAVLVSEAPL